MRLENLDIGHIYAGVCVLIQFGSTKRGTTNKPHATIIEWDDEIILYVLSHPFLLLYAYDPKAVRCTLPCCNLWCVSAGFDAGNPRNFDKADDRHQRFVWSYSQ